MELLSNMNVFIINQIHVDVLSQMKNKYKKKTPNPRHFTLQSDNYDCTRLLKLMTSRHIKMLSVA